MVQEAIKPLKDDITKLTGQVEPLKHRISELQYENEKMKEEIIQLQCYDRKDNLKFFGIQEQPYETKTDCKRTILNILRNSNIRIHPKGIENAYRIGPKQRDRSRPIVIKMFHAEEKELLFAKSQHVWDCTHIRIEEDFPPYIEADRKILKPILKAASQMTDQNGIQYRASMRLNKLNVNGTTYTTKTMSKLPPNLNPEKIATPTDGKTTAFFTASSPFSNHHLSDQVVEGKKFNCNEQYYMYKKATTFKDFDLASKILKEKDPGRQKNLGRRDNVANYSEPAWRERCIEIMKIGLKCKFDQNPRLKNLLLETGTTMLIEANPGDKFWGCGLSIQNPRIWKKNPYAGQAQNHMGLLLSELRREYK